MSAVTKCDRLRERKKTHLQRDTTFLCPRFRSFNYFITMPKGSTKAHKAPKASKAKLPDIPWADDDFKLVSAFLTELEKTENYKVLFGKKTPGEVRSTFK
jgi:hypothetical protein